MASMAPDNARTGGIKPGVRFADYCKIQAMNMTTLLWGRCSMAHVKAAIDGKLENESDALAMGRAFHCRILEPDIYLERVAIAQQCEAELKSGARKGEKCGNEGKHRSAGIWYCGQHKPDKADDMRGIDIISNENAIAIEGMRQSVMAHPIISQIRRRGGFETTVVADLDGVRCKVRFDKLLTDDGRPVAIDLKKCRLGFAKPHRVEKAIEDYGYHIRAAFYRDVLAAADPKLKDIPFILVFVEDKYPHAVSCVEIGDAVGDDDTSWIDVGRAEYRRLLAAYKESLASGKWPGYVDEVGAIDVRVSYPPKFVVMRHKAGLASRITMEPQEERHPDADIVW